MPMDCWPTWWKSQHGRSSTGARSSMRGEFDILMTGIRISFRMETPLHIVKTSIKCATTSSDRHDSLGFSIGTRLRAEFPIKEGNEAASAGDLTSAVVESM